MLDLVFFSAFPTLCSEISTLPSFLKLNEQTYTSYRLRFRDKESKANSGISSNFSDQRQGKILKRDDCDCTKSQ